MSDEQDKVAAPDLSEQTAEQILAQIKEKQRELDEQKAEPTASVEPDANSSSESTVSAESSTEPDKPTEPAQESKAGVVPGPVGKDKPEWKAWIEKKGFKSTEDMVRSMRELERELHRRAMANRANAQPQPPADYSQMQRQQSSSAPTEEELAKRYNMDPEDLRRVGPLAADIATNITAQKFAPLMAEMNRLSKEVARNAELQTLKEDPAFADPRVQFEMHRILENDPSILQMEPAPYRYALNEALRNMGRRILEDGSNTTALSEGSSGQKLPGKPPITAGGSGSRPKGTPGISEPGPVNPNTFASLPLAEKRKLLVKLGAVPKN